MPDLSTASDRPRLAVDHRCGSHGAGVGYGIRGAPHPLRGLPVPATRYLLEMWVLRLVSGTTRDEALPSERLVKRSGCHEAATRNSD